VADVPNPAGPEGRPGWHADGLELSRPSKRLVQLADSLPDWMGSVRFRLTALYSLVLFGLAAFMVAGLYALLATRLDDEKVYITREITVAERVPGGFTLTPTRCAPSTARWSSWPTPERWACCARTRSAPWWCCSW